MNVFQTISKGERINFLDLPERVGIIGSRSFANGSGSSRMLTEVWRFVNQTAPTTVVVSGGAVGIDEWAARMAQFCNKQLPKIYWPDRTLPTPARYFARNTQIADDIAEHDGVLIAFCDPTSWDGSRDTIRKAYQNGTPTVVFFYTTDGRYIKGVYNNFERYIQ